MRITLFALLALSAACDAAPVTLRGSLAEGAAATEVWVVGSATRSPIENGAFSLEGVTGDTVELRFATGGDEEPRMLLYQLPDGGVLDLEEIWFDRGSAFPLTIGSESDDPVLVNGLRMARAGALAQDVNLSGTVLAASEDGDALLVRPSDEGIADLDVLITPASVVRTIDGDPVDADRLDFGDTVRVSGIGESGRVVAAEILVSRRTAVGGDDRSANPDDQNDGSDVTFVSAGTSSSGGAAAGGSSGPEARAPEMAREAEREKDRPNERGKGKGRAKGRD